MNRGRRRVLKRETVEVLIKDSVAKKTDLRVYRLWPVVRVKGSISLGYRAVSEGDWCPLFRRKLVVSVSGFEMSIFEI